jgi:hypothetical protein
MIAMSVSTRHSQGGLLRYLLVWSIRRSAEYSFLTADGVRDRLIEIAGLSGWSHLNEDEMKTAEHYFPGIFDEDL